MKKLLMLLTLLPVFALPARAQKMNVIRINGQEKVSPCDGLYYNLPKTSLAIDVTVTMVELVKGPYAEFAGKYLGLSNVIVENSISYSLSDITIKSLSAPDPEQSYFIEMPGKAGTGELQLRLSESGLLLNTNGEDRSTESYTGQIFTADEGNIFPDVFKYFSDLNLFEQVDTIIDRSDTVEKIVLHRTLVEKTPEQKAKDAADFIIKIKENRMKLISGYQEVNYDKETFLLMNGELEKLETEYQKLFTGLTFVKTKHYHFFYNPDPSKPSDTVSLFRFSKSMGITDTASTGGQPGWIIINANGATSAFRDYVGRKEAQGKKKHGIYYRLPENATISMGIGEETRMITTLPVNQFGVVTWLPAKQLKMSLYPNTAGLQKINF